MLSVLSLQLIKENVVVVAVVVAVVALRLWWVCEHLKGNECLHVKHFKDEG